MEKLTKVVKVSILAMILLCAFLLISKLPTEDSQLQLSVKTDNIENRTIVPNEEICYTPTLINKGSDKIVYLAVYIKADILPEVADDGTVMPEDMHEIFYIKKDDDKITSHLHHISDNWIEIPIENMPNELTNKYENMKLHILGYKSILKKNKAVIPPFEKIQLINTIEDALSFPIQYPIVESYSISIANAKKIVRTSDITDDISKETLESIFSKGVIELNK